MNNSFAKIDTSNITNVNELLKIITNLKVRLDNTLGALLHLPSTPNYKYMITYMYGNSGISVSIDSENIYKESMDLVERLITAGVPELQGHPTAYAEFRTTTIDSLIDSDMVNNQLIVKGSDIRYRIKTDSKKSEPWLTFTDNLKVHINRLELSEEDIQDYQKRQMIDAFDKIKKMGYVVDDNGVFIVK